MNVLAHLLLQLGFGLEEIRHPFSNGLKFIRLALLNIGQALADLIKQQLYRRIHAPGPYPGQQRG
ncbi:hypothetical protein D3C80_1741580 [compost metagenome]